MTHSTSPRPRSARCSRSTVWALLGTTALACWMTVGTPAAQPLRDQAGTRRIISLVPAVTEMLFAIGAGADVVGVSSFDRYPPEVATRPKVGALIDPDFERILTLRPDLVVVYGSQDDLMARLTRASIPLFTYRHGGLKEVTATIRELGLRVRRGEDATRVAATIERELDAVRTRAASRPHPSTALVFGREPGALRGMYASGGRGFLHELLVTSGGRNAFADMAREGVQISTETLLARGPEVVLEIRSSEGWTPDRIDREIGLWKRLASLPAVRDNRIHILVGEKLAIPGPRVAEAARAFVEALHPTGSRF